MAGKLDEVSRVVGNIEAQLENFEDNIKRIVESIDRERGLNNARHQENLENLQKIDRRVDGLERTVKPVVKAIDDWKPVIDGVLQSKWKRAFVVSFFVGLGYVIYFVVDKLGSLILSALHIKPP